MKCPCCKTQLIEWKKLRLETLDEHICKPNGPVSEKMAYVCPAPGCPVNAAAPAVKVFWNEEGALYNDFDTSTVESFKRDKEYFSNIPWIDGNDAPFGTFQRQINVEIYKKNENKIVFVVPKWFPIRKGWICEKVWHYKSNENGDILKRSWSLNWWIPNGMGSRTRYISGISMMKFELRTIWRNIIQIIKGNDKWAIQNLQRIIERSEWKNAEWWRHCGAILSRCVIGCANAVKR